MDTPDLTLGAKIKELRLNQGYTQAQVADAIHISAQAYSRWENDERQPSYHLLAKLLYILGNPTLRIENKTLKIGDEPVTLIQNQSEDVSPETVLSRYQMIIDQTKDLTTVAAIQKFAEQHPEYTVELNLGLDTSPNQNEQSTSIRYIYKNLTIYASLKEGEVVYHPKKSFVSLGKS